MTDIQFFSFVLIAFLTILLFIFDVPHRLNRFIDPKYERIVSLKTELMVWKAKVQEIQKELEEERRINRILSEEINSLKKRIENLEDKNPILTSEKATLLVLGDNSFGTADRNALRRAGVLFHRLIDGSFKSLREELQRKRSEGRQYKIVHISSHASELGIQFSDGVFTGDELSNILDDIHLLFLASCNNVSIADKVLGIVDDIIVVYENVNTNDMESFVFEFYNELKINFDIDSSFNSAIKKVPSVAEFVDRRHV